MTAVSFFGGAFYGGEFFNFPLPATVVIPPGGDSTRLKKRGRRPLTFWEASQLKKFKEEQAAEAVFDAVADAYAIEDRIELFDQVAYLRAVERRLRDAQFLALAAQIKLSLKDLQYRLDLKLEEAQASEILSIISKDLDPGKILLPIKEEAARSLRALLGEFAMRRRGRAQEVFQRKQELAAERARQLEQARILAMGRPSVEPATLEKRSRLRATLKITENLGKMLDASLPPPARRHESH